MVTRLRTHWRLLFGAVLALVTIAFGLAFLSPAHASVATGKIAVCATDSTGANIVLGGDQAWYKQGSSYYVGPVGASGCRESTLTGGTSVEVWVAKNGTYSQHLTGTVPSDGGTLRFDFYTTKVTLQYSHAIAFGGANGDSAFFAKPSMELFSDGVTPVHFRLDGTGGASGRTTLVWPVATTTGKTFVRSFVVLRLLGSTGAPLAGGTARYQYGSWYYAPGSTDPNGILAYSIAGLVGNVTNEMRFNNTTQTKTQDASVESVYQFQTRLLTLRLQTCAGDPLNGGNARYGIGGVYTTWWFPGGATGTSAAGETAAQVFPGTYSFEMQYKGTSDRKLSVVVPNADSSLNWNTTAVTLNYSGQISYGGPSGDSAWFTKPTMELLPGTYKFHFRNIGTVPGTTVDLTFNGCTSTNSLVIARLLDHTGAGIPGGVVDYAPGGSWLPFGTTDASGVAYLLTGGTLGNIQVRMGFHNGSQTQSFDASTHSVFTFQTVQAAIRLVDHNGAGLAGGGVQQGGGSWIPVGTTDASGNVTFEVFPGTYKFSMAYNAGTQELTQDIATPVVFQTGAVHSDSGAATQYAQGSWQPFTQDVELLPGSWHFTFSDGTPVTYYTIAGGTVNHIH